jgi:hypothetical protein
MNTGLARNAPLTGRHAYRSGLVSFLGRSRLRAPFRLLWSHLWSHSRRFRGVRSGAAEPRLRRDQTQPNGSEPPAAELEAREGQPSAGSNPAATASLTRPNAGRAATWAPAFFGCGLKCVVLPDPDGPSSQTRDIHAVEMSPEAAAYARRNLADTLVVVRVTDMTGTTGAGRHRRPGDRQPRPTSPWRGTPRWSRRFVI